METDALFQVYKQSLRLFREFPQLVPRISNYLTKTLLQSVYK